MGTALLSFENKPLTETLDRSIRYQGGILTYHADSNETGGNFALLEFEGGPGSEPPLHVHRNEDEMFYVLEGKLKAFVGGEEITLSAGQAGFLPRNVPHTFKILSSHVRVLVYITPGGFENYFRELGKSLNTPVDAHAPPDIARMIRVAGLYSVTFMP